MKDQKNNKEERGSFVEDLRISHLQLSEFKNESRILKEIESAQKKFPNAHISFIGMKRKGVPLYESFQGRFDVFREKLTTLSLPKKTFFQTLKYLEWILRVTLRLKKLNSTIIHCHSLPALPAAVFSKFFLKCTLVYDAHELETECYGFSPIRKKLSRLLENFLIKCVDNIIVVSPSIQSFYKNMYPHKKIRLIVNAHSLSDLSTQEIPNLRKKIGITENEFLFICIGGLNKGRGVEMCLEAFKILEPPYHLLFLGYGDFEEKIKEIGSIKDNIHYLPPVPHHEVINTLKNADVLIRLFETSHLNHTYSLPNGIFQAEMAGIPYVVNKNCTDIVNFFSSSSLCIPIKKDKDTFYKWILNYKRETFPKRKENVSSLYTWEMYEQNLFDAYRSIESSVKKPLVNLSVESKGRRARNFFQKGE
jgi:glycosyltransferase involved in cell wall biosynthesis